MVDPENLRLHKVKITHPRPRAGNTAEVVRREMESVVLASVKGKRIALAVGSRGIADIDVITATVARVLESRGAIPFVIAAMGSHGGGTVEGQIAVLGEYGVSEAKLGIPVRADTDTVKIPAGADLGHIDMNRTAYEADGIIVINRIKKHTDIHGEFESGLLKMIVIGLGNLVQAERFHSAGLRSLQEAIPVAAEVALGTGKILLGVAIVENAFGEIARIEAVPPADFFRAERRLLRLSKRLSPSLPVSDLDVLLIDRGGKDISGSCIDTNVIGRMNLRGEGELRKPTIKRVVVFELSEKSHGNAAGIGLADFITKRFFDSIEFKSTNRNCISCYFPERGMIPIVMESDAEAIRSAIVTARNCDSDAPRIIRIRDTLHLEEMYVSDTVLDEIGNRESVTVISKGHPVVGPEGTLAPF